VLAAQHATSGSQSGAILAYADVFIVSELLERAAAVIRIEGAGAHQ
jgi:hypothetical protein